MTIATAITTFVTEGAEGSEHTITPYVIGASAFVILMVLLLGLMAYGKGREHT